MGKHDRYVSYWDKRRPVQVEREFITLQDYADKHYLTYQGAYRRLCSRKIKGFKAFGRWFVYL